MIKCGLDLGGSQVRYGISKTCIRDIEAKILEIDRNAPVKDYASDDKLSDFVILKHPMSSLCNRRFVRGEAMDHYRGDLLFCDNQKIKVGQEITYINAAYAIAQDCVIRYYCEQDVTIVACIPTSEFYSEGDLVPTFKSNLTGDYEILFPRTDKIITFRVKEGDVSVVPEGVVAVTKYGRMSNFANGITLVVDVGHRSTDITLLRNFRPIGNSAVSRPKGGMNIAAFVKSNLERDGILLNTDEIEYAMSHRYIIVNGELEDVTDLVISCDYSKEEIKGKLLEEQGVVVAEDLNDAMNRYYIKQGSGIFDMTPYVTAAKKAFCSSIKNDIIDVLAVEMMNLSSVNNIVPIGRSFSGDVFSTDNMVNILMDTLFPDKSPEERADVFTDGNLARANIQEIMKLIDA